MTIIQHFDAKHPQMVKPILKILTHLLQYY